MVCKQRQSFIFALTDCHPFSLGPCFNLEEGRTLLKGRSMWRERHLTAKVHATYPWLFPQSFFTFHWLWLISHSVQFSRSVMSDSLRPHESQHARPIWLLHKAGTEVFPNWRWWNQSPWSDLRSMTADRRGHMWKLGWCDRQRLLQFTSTEDTRGPVGTRHPQGPSSPYVCTWAQLSFTLIACFLFYDLN